ncbi:hypothetical protein GD1_126 [Paraglaciecola Antarctic GD virus 1]|nr:hypothetical protein GD1_126 [Paraglaciecola Antarctic GD virus 1]
MSNHLYGIVAKKINAKVGGVKTPVNLSTFVASTMYTEDLCAAYVTQYTNAECSHWQLDVKKAIQYVGRRREYFEYLYETPKYFVEQLGEKSSDLEGQKVYEVPAQLVGKKFTGVYDEYAIEDMIEVGTLTKQGRGWVVA